MAAAGYQAEKSLHDTMEKYHGNYILMVEGSIPTKNEAYCTIGGKSSISILKEAAEGAKAVVAWGNCASAGCVRFSSRFRPRCLGSYSDGGLDQP